MALLPGGSALDNGLALTPPMGYNGLRTPRLPRLARPACPHRGRPCRCTAGCDRRCTLSLQQLTG